MKTMTLTIEGKASEVEGAIICAMEAVGKKFPEQSLKVVVFDSEYKGRPITIKDNTPDSWIK